MLRRIEQGSIARIASVYARLRYGSGSPSARWRRATPLQGAVSSGRLLCLYTGAGSAPLDTSAERVYSVSRWRSTPATASPLRPSLCCAAGSRLRAASAALDQTQSPSAAEFGG